MTALPLIVVTCFDPALDPLFPALGLESGETFWLRTAGAFVPSSSSTLRMLMVAVFLFDAQEIVVVGHRSCRMASFDTSGFVDSFRKRGVPREAFGTEDLREWAGAIPNPRRGVELSVQNILAEPVRPRELRVSGAVLDEASATLSPVPVADVPVAAEPPKSEPDQARVPALPDAKLAHSVEAIREVLRESAKWSYEVGRLREELSRQVSPLAKLRLLTSFVKKVGADSEEVLEAFELLKKQVPPSSNPAVEAEELVRLLERLLTQP